MNAQSSNHAQSSNQCPECHADVNRRDFVKTVGGAAMVVGSASLLAPGAFAGTTSKNEAETVVQKFYNSLSEAQQKEICLPFGHKLQHRISANWQVTKPRIVDDFYSDPQRKMIFEIVKAITSKDGYERIVKQTEDDDDGMDAYHVAIFGKPGTKKFQWVMSGRHLTMRADGNSVENMAFGGPVIYGHGESNPAQNLFHFQTKQANEVFHSLDAAQRKTALLQKAPRESAISLQGKNGKFPGISVGELSVDQQELVEKTIKTILGPYRKEDIEEATALLKKGGGLKKLRMAFYSEKDIHNDKVWDIWRIEGPTFVAHFRGAPHVHAYINIGMKKDS